jgi:hypothetical protein
MFSASLFLACDMTDTSDNIEAVLNIEESYWDIDEGYEKIIIDFGYFTSYREGWVYARGNDEHPSDWYMYPNFLYRMRPDGSEKQKISDDGLYDIVYHNEWVYYIDEIYMSIDYMFPGQYSKLCRMRLDGSQKTELASDVASFEIIGEKIYYRSDYSLYHINTDGSGKEKIIDNCSNYLFADGYIFATYGGIGGGAAQYDTKLMRYDMDGKGEILNESDRIVYTPLFTDGEYLYYRLYFGGYYIDKEEMRSVQLHRMRFDGSNRQTVIEHEGDWIFGSLYLKDGYIYYSRVYIDRTPGNGFPPISEIYKIRTDGTDRTVIRGAEAYSGSSFDLIGNSIFYTTQHTGGKYNAIRLHHLSLNGEHRIVYDTGGNEYFSGYFIHNRKLYLVLGK